MLLFGPVVPAPQANPQLLGGGFRGGAYLDCSYCEDKSDDEYAACLTECQNQASSAQTSTGNAASDSSSPWYTAAASAGAAALAKEAASLFMPSSSSGARAPVSVPRPTPWYATPIGIGGIAIGIVAVVMLLRR